MKCPDPHCKDGVSDIDDAECPVCNGTGIVSTERALSMLYHAHYALIDTINSLARGYERVHATLQRLRSI